MSQSVTITTSPVPTGFCFTTWQQSWGELVNLLGGTLPGDNTTFSIGKTAPTAANQGDPWFRLESDGSPDMWYYYWNGVWCAHMKNYSIYERRIWTGTPALLWSWDGGDGNDPSVVSPTLITGATWEVDTDMSGRFAVGVGNFDGGGSVAVNGTGGEDEHTLTIAEMPAHTHDVNITRDSADDNAESTVLNQGTSGGATLPWISESVGGDTAHNNLPPYYGVYWVMRTARQFYTTT